MPHLLKRLGKAQAIPDLRADISGLHLRFLSFARIVSHEAHVPRIVN